jgi:hypothetical protein
VHTYAYICMYIYLVTGNVFVQATVRSIGIIIVNICLKLCMYVYFRKQLAFCYLHRMIYTYAVFKIVCSKLFVFEKGCFTRNETDVVSTTAKGFSLPGMNYICIYIPLVTSLPRPSMLQFTYSATN